MGVLAVNTLTRGLVGCAQAGRENQGRTSGAPCRVRSREGERETGGNSVMRERESGTRNVGKGVESNAARIGAGTPIRTTSAHYRPLDAREGRQ